MVMLGDRTTVRSHERRERVIGVGLRGGWVRKKRDVEREMREILKIGVVFGGGFSMGERGYEWN